MPKLSHADLGIALGFKDFGGEFVVRAAEDFQPGELQPAAEAGRGAIAILVDLQLVRGGGYHAGRPQQSTIGMSSTRNARQTSTVVTSAGMNFTDPAGTGLAGIAGAASRSAWVGGARVGTCGGGAVGTGAFGRWRRRCARDFHHDFQRQLLPAVGDEAHRAFAGRPLVPEAVSISSGIAACWGPLTCAWGSLSQGCRSSRWRRPILGGRLQGHLRPRGVLVLAGDADLFLRKLHDGRLRDAIPSKNCCTPATPLIGVPRIG